MLAVPETNRISCRARQTSAAREKVGLRGPYSAG